jgi:hypothetical protein
MHAISFWVVSNNPKKTVSHFMTLCGKIVIKIISSPALFGAYFLCVDFPSLPHFGAIPLRSTERTGIAISRYYPRALLNWYCHTG